LPGPCVLPDPNAHFVPPFGVFRLADRLATTARVARAVLGAVATTYPLGNCDSLTPETSLSYLTRLGTVSNRS